MNLLLIFGGKSYEHSISIKSFLNVYQNLDREKYNIFAVYINEDGEWIYLTDEKRILASDFTGVKAVLSPDTQEKSLILLSDFSKIKIDVIFPVLHGKNGEDGAIQGLFELCEIPYVGCKVTASANSLDKSLTKIIIDTTSVKQNPYVLKTRSNYDENTIENEISSLKFPLFVKCASGGSSVGVYKSMNIDDIKLHMKEAFTLDFKVLIEQGIVGREVEVAVLGNENPIASTVGEIATEADFYSFDSKYNDNTSSTFIPARISDEIIEKVRSQAIEVYKTLGASGLSRVDFFVTDDGDVVFNEINTLPGFTNISMYPKLFEYSGITYSNLLDKLIEFALESKGNSYE